MSLLVFIIYSLEVLNIGYINYLSWGLLIMLWSAHFIDLYANSFGNCVKNAFVKDGTILSKGKQLAFD